MYAITAMIDELNVQELLEVEDFIVNECDDSAMCDDTGYPNIFRIFICKDPSQTGSGDD